MISLASEIRCALPRDVMRAAATLVETPIAQVCICLVRELRQVDCQLPFIAQTGTVCVASLMFHRIRAKRATACLRANYMRIARVTGTSKSEIFRKLHSASINFMETFSELVRLQQFPWLVPGTPELNFESFGQSNYNKARNGAIRNSHASKYVTVGCPPRSIYPHLDLGVCESHSGSPCLKCCGCFRMCRPGCFSFGPVFSTQGSGDRVCL